jgi:hypothetical protein
MAVRHEAAIPRAQIFSSCPLLPHQKGEKLSSFKSFSPQAFLLLPPAA